MSGFQIIGLFLLLSLLGVPLAVSMGLSAVTYMVIAGIPLATIAHRMGNALNSFPLLAVVLFIFVGSLLNATGITHRLYEAAKLVVGRVRGGLAYVNVLANLVMAGISGAALADIGALGNIQIKAMKEQGYKEEMAASITVAAATLGPIFPPSIPMIIYASVAEVSGIKLLIAGIVPALVITLCLCVQVWYFARKYNFPLRDARAAVAGEAPYRPRGPARLGHAGDPGGRPALRLVRPDRIGGLHGVLLALSGGSDLQGADLGALAGGCPGHGPGYGHHHVHRLLGGDLCLGA